LKESEHSAQIIYPISCFTFLSNYPSSTSNNLHDELPE
jgi:hypothetical protein